MYCLFVVYLYLTSAKCTGIAAFSLWPEATALTEMVKVELYERKKMNFIMYNLNRTANQLTTIE